MGRFFIAFSLFYSSLATCCLNCLNSSSTCLECTASYNLFKSKTCLSSCPTGYISNAGKCEDDLISKTLFDLDFSLYSNLSQTFIENFYTYEQQKMSSPSNKTLSPTLDRGLYSNSLSGMYSSVNWIPGPDMTYQMWIYMMKSGIVLQALYSDILNIQIDISSSYLSLYLKLKKQLTGEDYTAYAYSQEIPLQWNYINILANQDTSTSVNVKIYVNGKEKQTTHNDYEFQITYPSIWIIGSNSLTSSAFSGFLYSLRVDTDIISTDLPVVSPPPCNVSYYYTGSNCESCPSSCLNVPNCISSSSCSICAKCQYCSGYSSSDCYCDGASCCQSSCLSCKSSIYICEECEFGYTNTGGICKINTVPEKIYKVFAGNFLGYYGDFRTGDKGESYYFGKDPETLDPVPAYQRGLYFTSGKYLLYEADLTLGSNFSIGLWIKPLSGGLLYKGPELSYDLYAFKVQYSNSTASYNHTCGSASFTTWNYISLMVETSTSALIIASYNNSFQNSINSFELSSFIDSSKSSLILGKSSTANYIGFIYSISIWKQSIRNFAFEYYDEPCGPSLTGSCLIECSINSYFDRKCKSCEHSCGTGCVDSREVCTICKYILCKECSSFDDTTCLGCADNASGDPCKCNDKFFYSTNEDVCKSCYERCQKCSNDGLKCDECQAQYLYTSGICLEKCPTGYTLSSSSCSKTTDQVFFLDVQTTLNLGTVDDFEIGNDLTNKYPDFDQNDPWPAAKRGFYFHSTAYIVKRDFIFSPFFSFNIWVMITSSGVILSKDGVIELKALSLSQAKIVITLMNGKTSESTLSFTSSYWNYLSFNMKIDSGSSYSTLKMYVNDIYKNSQTYSGFISDISTNPVYIGSSSSSFIGFIAIIKIYSIDGYHSSDYLLACSDCTICSTCLKSVLITNDPYDNSFCSAECTKGCYKYSCFICVDELCEVCEDRVTTSCKNCIKHSSGSPCECKKEYYQDGPSCKSCYERCSECTSSGYICTNCKSPWLFQNGLCLTQCSSGFTYSSSTSSCVLSSEKILDLDLKDYITLDAIGEVLIGSDNTNTYPNFDTNDPWPVKDRGYYFDSMSSMQQSLILAPNFTITFWAMPVGDGNILAKISDNIEVSIYVYDKKIYFDLYGEDGGITISTSYTSGKWNYYTVIINSQKSSIIADTYIDNIKKNQDSIDTFFDDLKSNIEIGYISYYNSFKGFLWSFRIYNTYKTDFSLVSPTNSCLLSQYPPNCLTCPTSCIKGCDNNYCNQCTDKLCYKCHKYSLPCDECSPNSSLIDNICQCNIHYYNNTNVCTICYNFCYACTNGYMDNCISCYDNLHLIDNKICGICGIGYSLEDKICTLTSNWFFALNFNNSVIGTVEDTASGIEILSGTSGGFYANNQPTDPVSSFLRGFYFDGISSYLVVSDDFILPYRFQVTFWVNLQSPSGVVIEKEGFSMYFLDTYLCIKLNLTESVLLYQSPGPSPLSSWHRIHFSLALSGNTSTLSHYDTLSSKGYFIDYFLGAHIGKGSLGYFHGFIYSLIIGIIQETRRINECLDTCEECLDDGYCIPNCPINNYWVGPHYNNCTECPVLCDSGCRNEGTCSLCHDEKCVDCDSLENESNCFSCADGTEYSDTCKCLEGYTWDPFRLRCFICESDQFIDNYYCIDCPGLCTKCESLDTCTECTENSHLANNLCECFPGFIGEETCERNILVITFTATKDNDLLFALSEALWKDLTAADIDVKCGLAESWYLEKWSDRQYRIKMTYSEYPGKNDVAVVEFTNTAKVVSLTNATPNNYTYTIQLNEVSQNDKKIIENAKNQGQIMIIIVTSTIIGASLFSNNPACLWSFINNIQMILFIVLASVNIPPKSKGLIISLKNYNLFPNIFFYFTPQGRLHDITRAYDIGYDSDSVIINIGSSLTGFLSFIVLWFILVLFKYLIQKRYCTKTRCKDFISKLIKDYKYGFFIRFWITNYIEFLIGALIGVMNWEYSSAYSIVNTVISALIIFSILITPILCVMIIKKRTDRLEQEQEEFDSKYGSLFYEFNKDKGFAVLNFYGLSLLRRAAYGFILIFLKDYGVLQMTLILIISIAFLLYLLLFRPFNDKFLNFFDTITEIGTFIIFTLIFWLLFDSSNISRYNIDFIIYYTIYLIMSIEICLSVIIMVKSVREKAREWRNKNVSTKVAPALSMENEEKENNYFRKRFSRIERVEMLNRENSRTVGTRKFGSFFEE